MGDKGLLNVSTYDILPLYKTAVDLKWHIKDVTEVQTLIILMRPSFTRSYLCIMFLTAQSLESVEIAKCLLQSLGKFFQSL